MIIRNSLTCERTTHGLRFTFREWSASNDSGMGWDTPEQRLNLALNLLEQVIPDRASVRLFKGKVPQRTLRLAPMLADQILSGLPAEGGTIPYEFIVDWLEPHESAVLDLHSTRAFEAA